MQGHDPGCKKKARMFSGVVLLAGSYLTTGPHSRPGRLDCAGNRTRGCSDRLDLTFEAKFWVHICQREGPQPKGLWNNWAFSLEYISHLKPSPILNITWMIWVRLEREINATQKEDEAGLDFGCARKEEESLTIRGIANQGEDVCPADTKSGSSPRRSKTHRTQRRQEHTRTRTRTHARFARSFPTSTHARTFLTRGASTPSLLSFATMVTPTMRPTTRRVVASCSPRLERSALGSAVRQQRRHRHNVAVCATGKKPAPVEEEESAGIFTNPFADGIFAPAVRIGYVILGDKKVKQLRGKGIALHSQVITSFCKQIGAPPKTKQGLIRLAKENGHWLGFLV